MSVNLSIKQVPDEVAEALRERARLNHRSIQGELLSIVETAVRRPRPFKAYEFAREIEALGLKTASESTRWIRELRDSR